MPASAGANFGLVEGRTFKPSPAANGTKRNWPITEAALGWLSNQRTLAEHLGPPDGKSLWFSMSTTHVGVERMNPYYRCTNFAERHRIAHLLDGNAAHPHRYRKTIARLALLALTGAPTLVMLMFGHNDLATTLTYLLADDEIRNDLRVMLGERRIEIGLNIMEDLDKSSGPAASVLKNARDRYFDEMKIPANERTQKTRMLEFVSAKLAEGGYDIKIVYPGIICIRALEQQGLCTRPNQEVNPSACQSNCVHRLELSLRRDEIMAIIEDLLDQYEAISDGRNELLASWFKSQLLDNASVFSDIDQRYRMDDRFIRATAAGGR